MTVIDRFLKYTEYNTTSDENSNSIPSTVNQLDFGKMLADDMIDIGLKDVIQDSTGYVYGFLPASKGYENTPCIGLIAHMDTSPDACGENVKARLIEYNGGDILLENGNVISLFRFPFLDSLNGEQLIVTDGSTLLGSDDKAGIAEILSTVEFLFFHPEIKHGKIAVAFTPDEEIGRGADCFNIPLFGADWAYTVDGGELGEIEYENFNAASARFTVNGVIIHPGSAKNKMKNAVLIASEIINMLPPAETPAHTEGYEGFYHVSDVLANESCATVDLIVRDHDFKKFEQRKSFLNKVCSYINEKYGDNTVTVKIEDSYYNMKEKIEPYMHIIDNAKSAMIKCNVKPNVVAIRGGTDGARLSYEGLPCPNLSTGGYNMHSVYEFIPVNSMYKMVDVLVELLSI